MTTVFDYTIPPGSEPVSIGRYLKDRGYSARILAELKHTPDGITRNGRPAPVSEQLEEGDLLTIRLTEAPSEHIPPAPVPFRICYEDRDILVAEKYADTPVHPAVGNHGNTLANGVTLYYKERGEDLVFRCINRLDRNTSGLILMAKHGISGAILSRQMEQRQIHRTYRALVLGHTPEEGTVDLPIGRKEGSIIERTVDLTSGDRAVTHYRTLSRHRSAFGDYSLLELRLDTGRTHQIRVHMAAIGHPLLGDGLYHPEDPSGLPRQALHSYRLAFTHPMTGEPLSFTCEFPEDLKIRETSSENRQQENDENSLLTKGSYL